MRLLSIASVLSLFCTLWVSGSALDLEKTPTSDVILVLSHPQAGVSLSGCLLGTLAEKTGLAYTYEGSSVSDEMITREYTKAIGRPNVKLPLIFCTSDKLKEVCYLNGADGSLTACQNNHGVSCPCQPGGALKCTQTMANCVNTLPSIRWKMLHFIRNPIDIVITQYLDNTSQEPDEWVNTTSLSGYSEWLTNVGVDQDALKSTGVFKAPQGATYGEFIRGKPPATGLLLETLRNSVPYSGMIRQYERYRSNPNVLTVRVEDIELAFEPTVRKILNFTEAVDPEDYKELVEAMKKCQDMGHPARRMYRKKRLTREEKVLMRALKKDGMLNDLCDKSGMLSYVDQRCFGDDKGKGGKDNPLVDDPFGRKLKSLQ